MRYSDISAFETCNGSEVGQSIFVQGCQFRCYNCFNSKAWDFNGGYEWTEQIEEEFLKLAQRPYIKRISILGGDPLAPENTENVLKLVNKIRLLFGKNKKIWLYTGYLWEVIYDKGRIPSKEISDYERLEIVKQCDVLVDDRYMDDLRDLTLQFRGSSNQRIIDIPKTLEKGEVVLWQN